ncbi:GGDEF domain-containing protein [Kineococcus esterisolvens]|uniref:GGDEF domain-containing protein n=1 Tax=unclassified Kineococcus TaxID=2621656 RepID=UPI003D7DAE00
MISRVRRLPLWIGYLLLAGLLTVACLCLRGTARDAVFAAVSASSAAAIVLGVRVHRPVHPGAWWCMAAGMGCWALGDVLYTLVYDVLGSRAYPAPPDVAYLLAYPLLAASLLSLARRARPGQDLEGVIDATILSVGAGLLSWAFLLRPALAELEGDLLGGVVAAAYPVADVTLLAVLVRLLSATGARSCAFRLLAAAAVTMLAADVAYQVAYVATGYDGTALDPVWLVSYLLWGAAALHPSMRRLSDPAPREGADVGVPRLLLLAGASLLAPGTLAVQLLTGAPLSAWAVVLSSSVLFLLVVARVWTLLRRVREQADQLAELARTDPLTGLANRRRATAETERLRDRALAAGTPLVLAVLDLDRFKRFNDTFGHPAGDRLLAGAARAWSDRLAGTGALVARWGGEEFVLVAEGLGPRHAEQLLAQLRGLVPQGQSFSAGLAVWDGAEEVDQLVARADAALYEAKAAGRGCTRTAPGPAVPEGAAPRPASGQSSWKRRPVTRSEAPTRSR